MGIGAAQGSAISLMAELSPTMHRGKLSMLVSGVGQAAGMGGVALLGIVCRNSDIGQSWWRTMLLLCTAPTVVGIFFLQNFVPESPHYCMVNGRQQEAEDLIRRLAKENGHEHKLIK
jgi:MFS family permease